MYEIVTDFERPDPALIERARANYFCLAGCRVGPRFVMDPGIKPLDREWRICGPAFTVRPEHTQDMLMSQLAGKYVKPGDIVVIDAGGESRMAVFGASMSAGVKSSGAAGVVIDGYTLTAEVIRARENIPVFCRGTLSVAGQGKLPGWLNTPVICGGVIVNPGDLILGDEDGVVVIPKAQIEEVIAGVESNARPRPLDGNIAARKPAAVPYFRSSGAEEKVDKLAADPNSKVRII
ncbi:MAG: RraA family protein [Rhodobacteraceae bacterium]|nr:RraA family protein [Paracoccaceae bacterium]